MKVPNILGVVSMAILAGGADAAAVSVPTQAAAASLPVSRTCSHLLFPGDFGRHVRFENGRYEADNLCYAEGTRWKEVALSGKTGTLYQRFDYYRPNVSFDTPLPVIVWAHPYGETENLNDERVQ